MYSKIFVEELLTFVHVDAVGGKSFDITTLFLQNVCIQKEVFRQHCMFIFQVEQMLNSEEYGKDLSSVQNLLKKHQLLEADVAAHEVLYYKI